MAQPYRFEPTHGLGPLRDEFGSLEAGSETGKSVTVAGRMMLRRDQGKLAFGTVRDWTGEVQLFAGAKWTKDFADFVKLPLGTWVGATGEVVATKRGELSVKVAEWVVLAEAQRSFGDKWRGVSDVDLRYRQREVDLWANEDVRNTMLARSRLVSVIRRWLEDRGFVEVETPVFHSIPSGGHAKPFVTHHNALGLDLFLRVAPELYLKRLVIGGFEKVFEIARVFRNEGLSPRHNPEFSMLELYWAYADYQDMMELVEEMVAHAATEICGTASITYGGQSIDLTPPWRRASMSELLEERIGVAADPRMPIEQLRTLCDEHGVPWKDGYGPGKLVLELYEKTTEATLTGPVFVVDYPKEVSPLSRDHREIPELVERFEAIVVGRELCNAFSELTDPEEQRLRFEEQARQREEGDEDAMAVDLDYVRALEYGLPPTAGLGIGIDRLAMLLTGAESIRDVLLFPTMRPEADA